MFHKKLIKVGILMGILFLATVSAVFPAGEQEKEKEIEGSWEPTKKVEFVVHNSAGSGSDAFIRTTAKALEDIVPVDINVANRPGAGGRDARHYLFQQEGNHHVLAGATQSWISRAAMNPNDYDHNDFTPVAHLAGEPVALFVQAEDDRFDTLEDFVEYAAENPGKVSQGGPDIGSGEWLATKMLEEEAGIVINYVSFKEGGNIMPSILGGHVDFIFANPGQADQYVESGDLKFLAVMMNERLEAYPDIPTFAEFGYDLEYFAPRGFYGPPNMPDEVVEYWEKAFEEALQTEIFQNWLKNTGNAGIYRKGSEYIDFIENFEKRCIPIMEREGVI